MTQAEPIDLTVDWRDNLKKTEYLYCILSMGQTRKKYYRCSEFSFWMEDNQKWERVLYRHLPRNVLNEIRSDQTLKSSFERAKKELHEKEIYKC